MFRVFVLVLLGNAICFPHYGQSQIDSLHQLLESYTAEDTIRVNILNQTGYEYWVINAGTSEEYGEKALALATKLQYRRGIAMAHRVIGVSHWSRGNFYHALTHLFAAQEQYRDLHDRLGEANATLNIGLVYGDGMYLNRALDYYFHALKIFEDLGREDRVATTFTKIGTVYIDQRKYPEAYQYLIKALDIHQRNGFSFGILETSNRLGILYRAQGNYPEAEKYLQRSLALAEERNDQEHIAKNLENLGSIALKRRDYVNAEKYLLRGYSIANRYGYKKWLRDIVLDLKNLYAEKNDLKKSLLYFEKYEGVRDSIFNEEQAMQIADLQLSHEVKEREHHLQLRQQEIKLLQEQARFDRLITFVLAGSLIALGLIGYGVFKAQKFRIQKNEELIQSNRQLYRSRQALAEAELENARLKEEELSKALEFKNKELTSYTMNFIHKNELMDNLKERLEKIKKQADPGLSKELKGVLQLVQSNQHIDRDWEDFKRTFENVHSDFFSRLLQYCPDLSPTELKLCALIKLNLSMKETASMMGISPDSVKTSRYRLRKKLNLQQDQSLTDFVINFSPTQETQV